MIYHLLCFQAHAWTAPGLEGQWPFYTAPKAGVCVCAEP